MTIAAEFQSFERCLRTYFIRDNVIEGPCLGVWRMLKTKRTGTGKETGSTLGMNIRPRLESSVQTSDQRYFILQTLQWFHGLG